MGSIKNIEPGDFGRYLSLAMPFAALAGPLAPLATAALGIGSAAFRLIPKGTSSDGGNMQSYNTKYGDTPPVPWGSPDEALPHPSIPAQTPPKADVEGAAKGNKMGWLDYAGYAMDALPVLANIFQGDSPEQTMRGEVLQEQIDETERLSRLGRGEFTPSEARSFTKGVRAAVGESLASRGISRSPIAADAYSRAAAEQLGKVQLAATQAAMTTRGTIMNYIPRDDSIWDDLKAMKESFAARRLLAEGGVKETPEMRKKLDALGAEIAALKQMLGKELPNVYAPPGGEKRPDGYIPQPAGAYSDETP